MPVRATAFRLDRPTPEFADHKAENFFRKAHKPFQISLSHYSCFLDLIWCPPEMTALSQVRSFVRRQPNQRIVAGLPLIEGPDVLRCRARVR